MDCGSWVQSVNGWEGDQVNLVVSEKVENQLCFHLPICYLNKQLVKNHTQNSCWHLRFLPLFNANGKLKGSWQWYDLCINFHKMWIGPITQEADRQTGKRRQGSEYKIQTTNSLHEIVTKFKTVFTFSVQSLHCKLSLDSVQSLHYKPSLPFVSNLSIVNHY